MKRLSTSLMLVGMLTVPVLLLADDDSERDTSVFDRHPECTERTEATASNPKCTPQDGPPNRKGVATRNQGESDSGPHSSSDGHSTSRR